ncbi:MAG TPA: hypothetical protein VMJ30_00790, partial [Gemmatimonadales bacterium]|nr:hypothetical protein [Gemmatimonadales bacterium]
MPAQPLTRSRSASRLILVLVVLAALGSLSWMLAAIGNPFPPTTIGMATGPEGNAYREFGARYQEILRRAGVEVRLIPTAGGVDNLARLDDPHSGVDVAFVESGVTDRRASPDLVTLGAVNVEPLWLFFRT